MNNSLIVLLGPTGVGKTQLSIELAGYFHTEIISSDSRQFYKELRIGTAVPDESELRAVPHHFIHHKSVTDYYNACQYEFDVIDFLKTQFLKTNRVFMVGGSGMYIDAVCKGIDDIPDVDMELRKMLINRLENEGVECLRVELKMLDPVFYASADLSNSQRILRAMEVCIQTGKPFSSFRLKEPKERKFKIIKIGLNMDRAELYKRIDLRVDKMIEDGLIDEARSVIQHRGIYALKTVGYKELFEYFDGIISFEKAVELIKQHSRHYARRQLTWFRRDKDIMWFHPDQKEDIIEKIKNYE